MERITNEEIKDIIPAEFHEDIFGVDITEYSVPVKAPSALKKERTIWQWKKDCKVHYPTQTIVTFVSFCLVFTATLIISAFLMLQFNPRSVISVTCYIICVISLIALAVTAGCFKGHNTWQYAFIRDENGDVYYVDYTDEKLANALHFYELIPSDYKHDLRVTHSDVMRVAVLTYYFVFFPQKCKKCLNAIRDNKVDERVADACHKYGYKITSVPEIKKKSYYTFIRFNIIKDGREVEVENLFDNCYEDYDEMVEYLDNHFEHDDSFMREKKADKIRTLLFAGIGVILLSIVLFVINTMIDFLIINIIAAFGVLLGIGLIAAFFSEKSKR